MTFTICLSYVYCFLRAGLKQHPSNDAGSARSHLPNLLSGLAHCQKSGLQCPTTSTQFVQLLFMISCNYHVFMR